MGLLSHRPEDDDEDGEVSIAGLEDLDASSDELVYELDDWSEHDRTVLRDRLETLAVPHRWEDQSLVVAADDEAWIERIMDQVDADLTADEEGEGEDEDEPVAYDLRDWDDDACRRLLDALAAEEIPYGLDGDELIVEGLDEARVDQIVAGILEPGAEVAGPATAEVMHDLFVGADRLTGNPGDHASREWFTTAAARASTTGAPYGIDGRWWAGVVGQARDLVARLEVDEPHRGDDDVSAAARALRDDLRPYV